MTPNPSPAAAQPTIDRRPVAVVVTTIHVPRFLDGLLENAHRFGHAERLRLVVVGDRQTPAATAAYLAELASRYAAKVTYLDLAAQHTLLRRWPTLDLLLRYDCVQRRNLGYLQAAIDGAEVIVSVDDDNYATSDDFLGPHKIVGRTVELPLVSHASGWWNVCQTLICEPPRRFYYRGYPKSRQDWSVGGQQVGRGLVRPVVNAGLWLGTPDVDATAHLEEPIEVARMEPLDGSGRFALAPGTWCPINAQNTSFDISVLPAMYLPVMLDRLHGYRIGRMDDVWMGYFLRALADPRGDAVLYGRPLVQQRRNPHHALDDLAGELAGYFLTERVVEYARSFQTGEATYLGAYLELIYHLRQQCENDPQLDDAQREYFRHLLLGMAAWHGAVSQILG